MATKIVSARWTGESLNFVGEDVKGNQVRMGEDDISPSQMVLLGLAGCTGMDVISILQKKQQAVTGLEVEVTGYQPDTYPKPYQTVEVKYIITGVNVDPRAVERAIQLSVEKYCVVSQTLQQQVALQTSFEVKA